MMGSAEVTMGGRLQDTASHDRGRSRRAARQESQQGVIRWGTGWSPNRQLPRGERVGKPSCPLQIPLIRVLSIESASEPERAPCIEAAAGKLTRYLKAFATQQSLQRRVPGYREKRQPGRRKDKCRLQGHAVVRESAEQVKDRLVKPSVVDTRTEPDQFILAQARGWHFLGTSNLAPQHRGDRTGDLKGVAVVDGFADDQRLTACGGHT